MKHTFQKATVSVITAALLLGSVAVPSQNTQAASKKVSITKTTKVMVGKTAAIKLKNNQKKATWKVTKGKKLIKLTKKKKTYATIKGVKKGTAKVQAVIGKKKYSCTVKVEAAKKQTTGAGNNPSAAKAPDKTTVPSGTKPVTVDPATTAAPAPTATSENTSQLRTVIYDGTNGEEIWHMGGEKIAVVIKDGLTYIEDSALAGCNNVASIIIPDSVTSIGNKAFSATSIQSIIIPNSVASIGDKAFDYCFALTDITIPDSVISIGKNAFQECEVLSSIQVGEGNPVYDSRNNCNAIIHTDSNELIVGCKNTIVPDSVTSIGDRSFYGSMMLTSMNIPDSVIRIGEETFFGCWYLNSIVLPTSLTHIGKDAFSECDNLTNITWKGTTYTSVEDFLRIFQGEKTDESDTPSAPSIPTSPEEDPDVTVTPGLRTIVYDGKNSEEICEEIQAATEPVAVIVQEGVTDIEMDAFLICENMVSISIPNSVTSIGMDAFYGCSGLTSIKLPGSLTDIGGQAFAGCENLQSISIPNSVTCIRGYTFYNCFNLTSITIPESVTKIEYYAFESCYNLTNITWKGTTYTSVADFEVAFGGFE